MSRLRLTHHMGRGGLHRFLRPFIFISNIKNITKTKGWKLEDIQSSSYHLDDNFVPPDNIKRETWVVSKLVLYLTAAHWSFNVMDMKGISESFQSFPLTNTDSFLVSVKENMNCIGVQTNIWKPSDIESPLVKCVNHIWKIPVEWIKWDDESSLAISASPATGRDSEGGTRRGHEEVVAC